MRNQSARGIAVKLLNRVIIDGRLLSELSEELAPLAPAERARALRLTTQTLRGLDRADRLLSRQLRKRPMPHVMNILRLGTVELCNGGDAHGVVNDLVALLDGNPRYKKLKGLVNAILRQMAGDAGKPWKDLRVPRLPDWLRAPLVAAWGNGAVSAMEKAHFSGASLDISVKENPEVWAERLGGFSLPTGTVRIDSRRQVSTLEGFKTGDWWVQDAAAAMPAKILQPKAGERILDMCAAPGGKTMQLAAEGASVIALDQSEWRIERLRENLRRTSLGAEIVIENALEYKSEPFDAILLDAPCSATGTIRRHPDLPYAKDGSEFSELIELQSALLEHAIGLLKPDGRLVYCTCSLLPDEGEVQIEELLQRHPDFKTDRKSFDFPGIDPTWMTPEGGLRIRPDFWPELGGMDGFYIACLRRA